MGFTSQWKEYHAQVEKKLMVAIFLQTVLCSCVDPLAPVVSYLFV